MKEKIYEHLKTKKKYNTLQLKYDVKCDELEHKILELNTEKKLRIKQQEIFTEKLQQLIEKNLELNAKLIKVKKDLKDLKNKESE